MKLSLVFLSLLLLLVMPIPEASGQSYSWATKAASTGSDAGIAVTTDQQGNLYSIGYYTSASITLGSGPSALTLNSAGGKDLYLLKQNCSGVPVWAVRIAGSGNEAGTFNHGDLVINNSTGALYVTASFEGNCSFGTTSGSSITKSSAGATDAFVACYNTNGVISWVNSIGSSSDDQGTDIILDTTGALICSGLLSGTCSFGTQSGSAGSLTSTGNTDGYIARYSSSGQFLNAIKVGGTQLDLVIAINLDRSSNIIASIATCCSGSVQVGPFTLNNTGAWGGVVAKLSSNMSTWLWAAHIGGSGDDVVGFTNIDDSNNVYAMYGSASASTLNSTAGGSFSYTPSSMDIVFAKFNPNGVLQWAQKIGGSGYEQPYCSWYDSKRKKFYWAGWFGNTVTFGTAPNTQTLTSIGNRDQFVAEYEPNGTFNWAQKGGSSGDDLVTKIVTDTVGAVYFTGLYASAATFGTFSLSSSGSADANICKIAAPYTTDSIYAGKTTLCGTSDSILLLSGGIKPGTVTLQWLLNNSPIPGATNASLYVSATGQYKIVGTNSCGDKDTSTAITISRAFANAGPDLTICKGDSVQIQATGTGSASWSPGSGLSSANILNPYVQISSQADYILTLTTPSGCVTKDTVKINTENCCLTCKTPDPINTNLIFCLPFNGNANDESQNGYNGLVSNATLINDRHGKANSAYSFNGVNSYIDLVKNIPDLPVFSFSMWIKPNSNVGNKYIFWEGDGQCGNDILVYIDGNSLGVAAGKNGTSLNTVTPVAPGTFSSWTHFAWVMNASVSKIYINGVLIRTINAAGSGVGNHYVPTFGSSNDGSLPPCGSTRSFFYNGALDDVRLYSSALSDRDVEKLYKITNDSISVNAGPDLTGCKGDSLQLSTTGYNTAASWKWSPSDYLSSTSISNPKAVVQDSISYIVSKRLGQCYAFDTINIQVKTIEASAGPDKTVTPGDSVQLEGEAPGATSFRWQPASMVNDSTLLNPYAKPISNTRFVFKANNAGCIQYDTVWVFLDSATCLDCSAAGTINSGLVACYTFDGDANDKSGNNNHGTLHGGISNTSDRWGNPNKAFEFNGSDAYVSVPNSASLSSPSSEITVSAWVYIRNWNNISTNTYYAPVLAKSDNANTLQYLLAAIDSGIDACHEGRLAELNIHPLKKNKWYHLAYTVNSAHLTKYYLDGILVGSTTSQVVPLFSLSNNNPLYIGRDEPVSTEYLDGKLDDIRIYNRALSSAEVRSLHHSNLFENFADAGLDSNICRGDSLQLSGKGGSFYAWHKAPGISDTSLQNPFVKPTTNSDYILEVKKGACVDKDSVRINVSALSVNAGTDTSFCRGDSVQLNAIAPGALTWSWSPANGLSNSTIPNPYAQPTAATTYALTVSDGICHVKDSILVKPYSLSVNAGKDSSICAGDSILIGVSSGGNTFSWSPVSGLSNPGILQPKAAPNSTLTYILTANLNQCQSSDTITITVLPKPSVTVSDTTVCENSPVKFSALSSDPNVRYRWNTGDTLSFIDIVAQNSGRFWVQVNNGSCKSDWDTAHLTVERAPNPAFTADPVSGKAPVLVNLSAIHAGAGNFYWHFGDTSTIIGRSKDTSYEYQDTGSYVVKLVTESPLGCKDSAFAIITAFDTLTLFIPSAFSPNGDGINDLWYPSITGMKYYELIIFDRWGEVLYQQDSRKGWPAWNGRYRGELVPDGVYAYLIRYISEKRGGGQKIGTITIIH